MEIIVKHDGKVYNFENGSEAFIFDIGTYHNLPVNQLIAYVSLTHECYLKDESDMPFGKFCDYVAMNWDKIKNLSPREILIKFYKIYQNNRAKGKH